MHVAGSRQIPFVNCRHAIKCFTCCAAARAVIDTLSLRADAAKLAVALWQLVISLNAE